MAENYKFRNFSMDQVPVDSRGLRWCVCGAQYDKSGEYRGGGVLEWCDSKADAIEVINLMERDPRFRRLSAVLW